MLNKSPIRLIVEGDYALFTRPEFPIERYTYDVITPSAAVGLLKSIYWKPSFEYVINSITVYNPIEFFAIKTNEMQNKIDIVSEAVSHGFVKPLIVETTQRNSIYLRNVKYLIEAEMILTGKSSERGEETFEKELGLFYKRVNAGKCFTTPYLGTKECAVKVFRDYDETLDSIPLKLTRPLGTMLHHIEYENGKEKTPVFFNAVMIDGVIDTRPKRSNILC